MRRNPRDDVLRHLRVGDDLLDGAAAPLRTDEGEPAPAAVRHALRDVIAHSIYAVDVNPMAVELCKVSLWLEALEPGRPLSFLDAHIKVGNSLLGATPELVAAGIPDAAFESLTGDDNAVARAWRTGNKQERDGQQALFEAPFEIPTGALAQEVRSLDSLSEETPEALAAKSARHAAYVVSTDHLRAQAALDAWCAAFVAPKTQGAPEIKTATVRAIGTNPAAVPSAVRDLIAATADQYAFFHWPIEFPAVFERGGFDVVIGNPPWERVKLQEREFFAERSPLIADARNAAERKRMIALLERSDPSLWQAFREALRRSDGESHLLRNSGRYPLAGRGDINTYAVFAELMRSVIGPRGRQGVILPTGIATDDTTKFFFSDLVNRQSLVSLFAFENEEFVFPGIHHAYRFCLLTVGSPGAAPTADLVFYARSVAALGEETRHFTLSPEDFALLNPNTRTCPTFRSRRDAELAKSVYRRIPVLIDDAAGEAGNQWGLSFLRMFDMANDSGRFLDEQGSHRLSLYEAKMIHQFDHRWATYQAGEVVPVDDRAKADATFEPRPQYWVDSDVVAERLSGRWSHPWLLGWRDITGAEKVRTVIASLIPRAAVNNKILLMLSSDPLLPWLLPILDSFVLDWVSRQKIGGTGMNYFLMKQLPVPTPALMRSPVPWADSPLAAWVRPYLAELVGTSDSMLGLLVHLGWTGQPFVWNPSRRPHLRAELDAAFFNLYGLSRDEVGHVMDSFWIVRARDERDFGSYRTKDLILVAYDAIAAANPNRPFASRLDPPPGDPQVANPPPRGDESGRWLPWSEVIDRPIARQPESATRAALPRPSVAARPSSFGGPSARQATAWRPVRDPSPQQTLAAASAHAAGDGQWGPETAVDPRDIVMGLRVRHRSYGVGTVLSVKPSGTGAELLVRFDVGEEKWIVFGFGVLEFDDSP